MNAYDEGKDVTIPHPLTYLHHDCTYLYMQVSYASGVLSAHGLNGPAMWMFLAGSKTLSWFRYFYEHCKN